MGTVPTPRPFVNAPDPASILTYADWNAAIYDNLAFLMRPPKVKVLGTASQTVTSGILTVVTWNTEEIDTDNAFSPTVTPTRIIPKTPGWYMGWYGVAWTGSGGQRRQILRKNGNYALSYGRSDSRHSVSSMANKGYRFWQSFNGTTDYIELIVYHDGGGTVPFADPPELFMRWWKAL